MGKFFKFIECGNAMKCIETQSAKSLSIRKSIILLSLKINFLHL